MRSNTERAASRGLTPVQAATVLKTAKEQGGHWEYFAAPVMLRQGLMI